MKNEQQKLRSRSACDVFIGAPVHFVRPGPLSTTGREVLVLWSQTVGAGPNEENMTTQKNEEQN